MPSLLARLVPAVALIFSVLPEAAHASACSTSGSSTLSCETVRNDTVDWDFFGSISGLFDPDVYDGCGVSGDFGNPQDFWIFTCFASGAVQITVDDMDCNLDLFLLDSQCATGSSSSCLDASTNGGTNPDVVDLDCQVGEIYYIGVERREANWTPGFLGGDCQWYEDHDYRITVDCFEECDDGVDNDLDGYIDCLDTDCPVCVEDCFDGVDNDFDGLADCDDPDCSYLNDCCDVDNDGFFADNELCGGDDCNDDPLTGGSQINPGRNEEIADGVDSDCDGEELCYTDADGDYFGVPNLISSEFLSCLAPGLADNPDDCDDTDEFINPGVNEIVANGVDDNCDGLEECYIDEDQDTYGGDLVVESNSIDCSAANVSINSLDCDDYNANANPGATELPVSGVDEDCNGLELCYEDLDGDFYGVTTTVETTFVTCVGPGVSIYPSDCDDTPGTGSVIYPGQIEGRADGIDQNCDGFEECWLDVDNDSYGNDQGEFQLSVPLDCSASGVSDSQDDCDDGDASIYPGAFDPPGDGIDQNCDDQQDCYEDLDGDGWGSDVVVASGISGCVGVGVAPNNGDCDDSAVSINPDATETPNNGIDEDCDGFETCFEDNDGDGFGSTDLTEAVALDCVEAGASPNDEDCDDTAPDGALIYPGATEIPNNGIDEDCNGFESCYQDVDNDGYGRNTLVPSSSVDCSIAGVSPNNNDCNDTPSGFAINPGADEIPVDNTDQNCDGQEDCYVDNDQDGYGVAILTPSTALFCNVPGVANNDDDCDDNADDVYPGAPQGPLGGVDYDCSGLSSCYQDLDGDGFGSAVQSPIGDPLCQISGWSLVSGDCDDNDQSINPNTVEIVNNGIDEDCDGFESCFQDLDGDGFGTVNPQPSPDLTCNADGVARFDTDCNDNPSADGAQFYPGAPELPASGGDENCDGFEDCHRDQDGDDYGHPTQVIQTTDLTCLAGSTYTDNNEDCDDTSSLRNPGRNDIPTNGIDEDCDGVDNCFQDLDGDNYGSTIVIPGPGLSCVGDGFSALGTDCYDVPPDGATVYPGATETPGDGVDSNCNGKELCYPDADGDSFGTPAQFIESTNLLCQAPGLSPNGEDCNDQPPPGDGASIFPGALESPVDGVDSNCDGLEACYQDLDADQYGTPTLVDSPDFTCSTNNVAPNDDDCMDIPPEGGSINPGATEIVGNGVDENCDGVEVCYRDLDGDGFGRNNAVPANGIDCGAPGFSFTNDDCDDTSDTVYPGAPEVVSDGIDQDCDGTEDCYRDQDGDDFGTTFIVSSPALDCLAAGVANTDGDCNDTMPGGNFIYPGAPEIPSNGIDEDCDGEETCFTDGDGDGFGGTGTVSTPSFDCDAPGATLQGGDCQDADDSIYPGATEVVADGIDQNCDGKEACYQDIDGDDYGSDVVIVSPDLACTAANESSVNTDCLDQGSLNNVGSAQINPAATEVCNELDDNCDGLIDDDDPLLVSQFTWYWDNDGDDFGNGSVSQQACEQPEDYVLDDSDCDDGNPNVNPAADEVCDPLDVDEDCNGVADLDDPDTIDVEIVHPDADNDGYGSDDPFAAQNACEIPPGFVLDNTDCDDADPDAWPGNPEVPYDGSDNDCDVLTPDDDLDGDGYVLVDDCNDVPGLGEDIFPGQPELPDFIDNDCNGLVDDTTSQYDDDGDGFTENGGDCNDASSTVFPGAPEQPNNVDDDCDGTVDEGTERYDDDGDGYTELQGDCNDVLSAGGADINPGAVEDMTNGIDDDCDGSVDGGTYDPDGDGYTAFGGDCDDTNDDVFPGAPELDDSLDNDCDGLVDEGTASYDDDGDGYTEQSGDCNDDPDFGGEDVNPGVPEVPNGIDDNCDGNIDEGSDNADDDGDDYAENQGDCDDTNADIFPGATEVENGVDDDCDGEIDENVLDLDGDGWTTEAGDCDDNEGWANPEAVEVCDGIDNDCDGDVDEGTDCGTDDTAVPPGDDKGCGGCASSRGPGGALGLLPVMLLVGLRRRRNQAA